MDILEGLRMKAIRQYQRFEESTATARREGSYYSRVRAEEEWKEYQKCFNDYLDMKVAISKDFDEKIEELCREGKKVYYVYTSYGIYFESYDRQDVVNYLKRNIADVVRDGVAAYLASLEA